MASLALITKLSNIGEFNSEAINLQFYSKSNVNLIVDFLYKVKNVITSTQSITHYTKIHLKVDQNNNQIFIILLFITFIFFTIYVTVY